MHAGDTPEQRFKNFLPYWVRCCFVACTHRKIRQFHFGSSLVRPWFSTGVSANHTSDAVNIGFVHVLWFSSQSDSPMLYSLTITFFHTCCWVSDASQRAFPSTTWIESRAMPGYDTISSVSLRAGHVCIPSNILWTSLKKKRGVRLARQSSNAPSRIAFSLPCFVRGGLQKWAFVGLLVHREKNGARKILYCKLPLVQVSITKALVKHCH